MEPSLSISKSGIQLYFPRSSWTLSLTSIKKWQLHSSMLAHAIGKCIPCFLSPTMQIAKTKEETSIRMLMNFDFGNRSKGAKFQLCINESWFISHVILPEGQYENLRKKQYPGCAGGFYCVILSSHKKCESSKGFSHLDPCYYGVSGSLHVGLAVNISGLLYMVCCKVPPTLVFCFPPSCVELMSKPLFSRWVEPTFTDFCQLGPWRAGGGGGGVFSVSRFCCCFISTEQDSWQRCKPVEQVECKKQSASAVNMAKREIQWRHTPLKSHTPGAWTSKSKQQKCDRNKWRCKSFHSYGECFLFSLLNGTAAWTQACLNAS